MSGSKCARAGRSPSLHIKVYRTDGTVEELEGLPSIDYEARCGLNLPICCSGHGDA